VRRREQAPERREGGDAPLWIRQTLQALAEYHRRFPGKPGVVPDGFSLWWRAERDAWCLENGCHRTGTKTCQQVAPIGKDCGARERAGS
jgi:hypothetical protein